MTTTAPLDPPIARHRTWKHLIRDLTATACPGLASIRQHDLLPRLAAPVALARWVHWQGLRPRASDRLCVAIVGAEDIDSFDDGHWYGLLPALLGLDLDSEVHLIGPSLRIPNPRFPRLAPPGVTPPRVFAYPTTFAEAAPRLPVADLDLAMAFQPGLENYAQWFAGPDLRLLVETGLPVGLTSYGLDEFHIDRRVLEAFGLAAEPQTQENPFFIEMGHANVRWGHTLWRLGSRRPADGQTPDRAVLERITALSRLLARLYRTGFVSDALAFGSERRIPGAAGQTLIYLARDLYLDPTSRELGLLRNGALQGTGLHVTPEDLALRPGPGSDPLDPALWVTGLFARYVN